MHNLAPLVFATQLTQFFELFLLCSNYSTIIWVYENSTIPSALSTNGHISIVINADLRQNVSNSTAFSNEGLLIVSVFDNDLVLKANRSIRQYHFNSYCHFLFLSRQMNASDLNDELMLLAGQYKLSNIGAILLDNEGFLKIFRIIHNRYSVVHIPTLPTDQCEAIHDKLFYPKERDLQGDDGYVYILFEPPRGINLTSHNKNGKQSTNVGGREAYLASLIPSKMNITLKMFALYFTADHVNDYRYEFLKEFFEKTYEEDNQSPKQLDYILYDQRDIWQFHQNHSIFVSLESEFKLRDTQYGLYPHEVEKFIMLVPNVLQRKSTVMLSIVQMPLFNVWAIAIVVFSVSRKILRFMQKSRPNKFCAIFFNTFALSFGTAGATVDSTKVSGSEKLLLWFLSLFAMLASILCSGMLFQEFATSSLMPSINSLADLGRNPHIEIWMPEDFHNSTETWLQQQVPNPINRLEKFYIMAMAYDKQQNVALIMPESKVEIILGRDDMLDNGHNFYHIINFNVVSHHLKFSVFERWACEPMNKLIQQTIENGLMTHFERRTKRIMRIKRLKQFGTYHKLTINSISMKHLYFVFILYAVGISVAIFANVGEIYIYTYSQRVLKNAVHL